MDYKCNYRILPNSKLIISQYSGDISENEIMSLKAAIKSDEDFKTDYNVLDDFRDSNFNITDESFSKVLLWLKNNYKADRKSAVLTSTPDQVVSIIRFDSLNKDQLPNRIRIFSTLLAAIQWIGLHENQCQEIEMLLEELKG